MQKNILITGGLGFVGSNLAEKCVLDGHNVTIISQSDSKIGNISKIRDRVNLKLKDIGRVDSEDVVGQDWIFHLAGTTHNYHIKTDPFLDINVNCNGTIALLEACRIGNPSVRMVYGSTFFVNGNQSTLPVGPNSPCNPLGLYPATRLAGENFCRIYNQTFGMNSTIVRFTNLFGVKEQRDNKQKAGFNYLLNLALRGEEIPLYNNGDFFRDYLYVSDAVDASMVVAEKGSPGEVYYAGRGEGVLFRDLIGLVEKEVGNMRVVPVSPPQFHKSVGITNFYCDNSSLRQLGWSPQVSLEEGVKRTLKWYRESGAHD